MTKNSNAPTPEQARRLEEFDQQERILSLQLANLHERRREYINTNELNKPIEVTENE